MLANLVKKTLSIWTPPPSLSVSEWAEANLVLSPEDSAEPGRYSCKRAPYQKGILDAFSQLDVEQIVVMSSAQIGKTLMLKAIIGYFIDLDPSPIMVVQPTIEMGHTFSKDRLTPMLRDSPTLAAKVNTATTRDSSNTIMKKNFPGGHLTITGANSPVGLASRPIRVLLCDEVDRYPHSAGEEGDPVNLAIKRTSTFSRRRKIALVSTPTTKGLSRIERAWLTSDQRKFMVKCLHCDNQFSMEWQYIVINDCNVNDSCIACPSCAAVIKDNERLLMIENGVWIATSPENKTPGFHLNELYSPWRSIGEIVDDYLKSRGNSEEEKTWWNTSMGLPYEGAADKADANNLFLRRENYDPDNLDISIITITAGVDTQRDRLEVEIVGWGANEESWGVEYIILTGSPADSATWEQLDNLLTTCRFKTTDGKILKISACCIDSGGHHVQQVYEYCTPRFSRNIWAIKGTFGPKPIWPRRYTRSATHKGHVVRIIGVDTAKDTLYAYLNVAEGKHGYCHFPLSYDEDWFTQLASERRIIKRDTRGNEYRVWQKIAKKTRNEALDCRVYAYAALHGLKIERRFTLTRNIKQNKRIDNRNTINRRRMRAF